MNAKIKILGAIGTILILFSCTSSLTWRPPKPFEEYRPPQEDYMEEGIKFTFLADPRLNLYSGIPHTLYICIYQLKDPNAFNRQADNDSTIYELLGEGCGFTDPSVVGSKPLTVQPGEKVEVALDRAEGARYVGLVAGYSSLKKDSVARLFDIPLLVAKKSAGCMKRVTVSKLAVMNIEVILGTDEIEKIRFDREQD